MAVGNFERLVLGTNLAGTDNGDGSITLDVASAAAAIPVDGWIDDTANTWTYASASTFTVTGDRTAVFLKGLRLKFTQTTVKYGIVAGSAHAAGTTTVTIIVNQDYVLANAAISANYFSPILSPQGYPGNFTWDPAATGFTGAVTYLIKEFSVVGNQCFMNADISGTSNATTFAFSMPVAALYTSAVLFPCFITNNGVNPAGPGVLNNSAATTACQVYRDYTLALAWTASGTKRALFSGASVYF